MFAFFFFVQFYCINTTAAGIAATAGFTEICHQSSEALTDSQPGGVCSVFATVNVGYTKIFSLICN